ncbi:hypothetical protein DKX38_003737 [Salix brachista]|uniref:Uncharacterized protein n=1 Tax=Salix brachista TaxID=2182728 RepID=A0A5N5NAQ8_9ROSI|nr:hypothetical protein DKX38_003737 [Salix brachista]
MERKQIFHDRNAKQFSLGKKLEALLVDVLATTGRPFSLVSSLNFQCLQLLIGTAVLERGQNLFVSLIDFSNCVIGQTVILPSGNPVFRWLATLQRSCCWRYSINQDEELCRVQIGIGVASWVSSRIILTTDSTFVLSYATDASDFPLIHIPLNLKWYRCLKVIENLQSCCEKCDYKSTHCASVSGLLKQMPK